MFTVEIIFQNVGHERKAVVCEDISDVPEDVARWHVGGDSGDDDVFRA